MPNKIQPPAELAMAITSETTFQEQASGLSALPVFGKKEALNSTAEFSRLHSLSNN